MNQVRVRFAPSPTGKLHIGTCRTALFNYLFARKNKGKFILRFEDTDQERSTKESEKDILDSLSWLGLSFDEGPYFQSQRLDLYQKYALQLIKAKKAYYCFCTPKEIEKEKEKARKEKRPYRYSGRCRFLTNKEIEYYQKIKRPKVIRFKLPHRLVRFNDLIKGQVEFDTQNFSDPIIMRSAGIPLYNLANVVDDYEMKITHVIRGEDLLSSTPIQILLAQELGFNTPQYAHMPLILAKDRTKLSKRHGAVAITDYKKMGYLPEALINFIVLLGWHPGQGDTRELFTLSELEKEFSLERVGESAAIFDLEKLNWFQEYYLRKLVKERKLSEVKKIFNLKWSDKFLSKIIEVYILNGRIKFFREIEENHHYLFKPVQYSSYLLVFKKSNKEKTFLALNLFLKNIDKFKKWESLSSIREFLQKIVRDNNLNYGDLFWPIRVALSGLESSPSPEELLWILGPKESIKRIKEAVKKIK